MMKTMTVGELKAQFSEVLGQLIKNGKPVAISYGKKKVKIAAIIPYSQLKPQTERPLGVMQGKASYVIHEDFALNDEDMLNS
jgi:antitoxin (DNA-binding transcriptional repressor) of toxin-antitoxin stability system